MEVRKRKIIAFIFAYAALMACSRSDEKEVYFYSSGNLRYEVPLKDGLRNGVLTQYYESGEIELRSHWKDGNKHGKLTSYYKNGNVKTVEYFDNNRRADTLLTYDSLGNIIEKMYFKDGVREGPYFLYYPTGQPEVKGGIKNDKKHGRAETYYPDGSIKRKEIYEEGELVYSVDYAENGAPFDIYLPIIIDPLDDPNKIKIGLEHSFYHDSYVGVIIGPLDDKGRLLDTLDKFSSDSGLTAIYEYSTSVLRNDTLSGMIYEINSDHFVEAEYPFKFNVMRTKDAS